MHPHEAIHTALCNDDAALFRATLADHPELKARINDPLGPFDSPLVLSVRSREMLDAFLEAGADLNARSKWWAGSFGFLDNASEDLAEYALTRGARLDVHSAARLNRIVDLRWMIAADPALVHARGGDGKTPLHCVRTVEAARFLFESGANLDARDIDHESTPAQYLIDKHQDVVRFLIDSGCAPDIFMAAALGDAALANRLMDADPNCLRMRVNSEHFPMRNPHAGGTIYQWTLGFNISPHETARKFHHNELYQLLLERSPIEVRLLVDCWAGDEAGLKSILDQDPSIASRLKSSEFRQLADAARNNDLAAVRLMLLAKIPLTEPGQHNGTALHWAAWHGNAEMVKLLLAHNPPLEDANNEFKCSPLAWAVHGSQNGWHKQSGNYPETVRAFLSAGAIVPNRTDGTPEVRQILYGSQA